MAGTSVRRRPCHRPHLLNIIYPDNMVARESVECSIREASDSERLAGHDLEVVREGCSRGSAASVARSATVFCNNSVATSRSTAGRKFELKSRSRGGKSHGHTPVCLIALAQRKRREIGLHFLFEGFESNPVDIFRVDASRSQPSTQLGYGSRRPLKATTHVLRIDARLHARNYEQARKTKPFLPIYSD